MFFSFFCDIIFVKQIETYKEMSKLKIEIDKHLFSVYPEIRLGLLHFHADVKESDNAFWEHMDNDVLPKVRSSIEGKEWGEISGINGSRAAYKAFTFNLPLDFIIYAIAY